ncbi:MAG: UPF0182 family protein [Bacillota bacterium]
MKGFKIKGIYIVAALLLLVIIFFSSIAGYLIDYQWFSELNYQEVFFKKLFTQIQFFVPTFILLFVVLFLYMKSINAHSVKHSRVILDVKEKKVRNRIFALVSFVVSFLFSLVFVTEIWYEFLIFINKSAFGIADPIFSKDIGFFMFTLPFLNKLYGFMLGFIVILAAITLVYNGLTFLSTKVSDGGHDEANVRVLYNSKDIYKGILGAASRQLTLLGGLFFVLLGLGFYLRTFDILYSGRGVAYGASYTDINVTLPSYYIYIAICAVTAVLMLVSWSRNKIKLAAFGPLLLIVAMVLSGVASAVVQNMIVAPNEISKEEKYLQYNIEYTNYAYGLDKVAVKPFAVEQDLTRESLEANITTINNIPINDYRPALDIYNQIQGLKNYYRFNDMDIDRYMVNGVYRQIFISPRELLAENIPSQTGEQRASWINRYLKYTHGYGISMSPVNEVTASGRPRLFIRDLPLISDIDIKVDVPQIYYGELTDDIAIVNTREKEFDYPASDRSVETIYQGKGGIKLSFINRLLFAVKRGDINFLLSQDITGESKVLINRDIVDRVNKIAPFLIYDEDPYIVTAEGKLYWIIDAYTINNRYPYSEPISENTNVNYLRNSVKVIVDAYNGTAEYYISDTSDPIIRTYSSIFKTLFKPLDEMPESLRAHIRYPQKMFDIQASIYKKYHMLNAREFYNKNDVWDIATQIYDVTGTTTERQEVESTYLIMKLPDSEKEEFLLMVPYTPQGKTNMIAWLAVKNDGENYGQIILYNFPSGKIVEGPMQVEGIISQDTVIGPQLNLLATGGNSQVSRGNMMVIPIEESILYVEPIYVKAINANALPEVKKVIVYYNNQAVMDDTLEKALGRIFPEKQGQEQTQQPPADTDTATVEELIRKANEIFQQAQEAQRGGDWAAYGARIKELEDLLNKLNAIINPVPEQPAEAGEGTGTEANQ